MQKCVRDLEAQLEELKAAGDGPNEELKVPIIPSSWDGEVKPIYAGLWSQTGCMFHIFMLGETGEGDEIDTRPQPGGY